jgi:threonine aldolase
MCLIDLEVAGCSNEMFVKLGRKAGLRLMSNRLVTHYQVAMNREEVLKRLEWVFKEALAVGDRKAKAGGQSNMYRARL